MIETAKSKIKNFKNQITEKFNVGEANGFRTYIGKLSPINVLDMLDDIERSVTTDKLSVEKLQEQNKTMKLALVELSDETIYDNTGFFSDEYAKNLVEQLEAGEIETIAERSCRNLQEQLNTAKKHIEHVIGTIKHDGHLGTIQIDWILPDLERAHAAIGLEGSGDE